jgi:uncharacterized membrane protein YuzA (DUF378 family)
MAENCSLCKTACWLILIGALNLGLVGIGGFTGSDLNVVSMVLGSWPKVESLFYVLVGLSALVKVFKFCPVCKAR